METLPVELRTLVARQVSHTQGSLYCTDEKGHIPQRSRIFASSLDKLERCRFPYPI